MGLLISVYRDASGIDCTNGGISSKVKQLVVTNVEGPFEPDENAPAVQLVKGPFNSVRLIPQELLDSGAWVMFGGNYGSTSDSRFNQAVENMCGYSMGCVKIFDRVEEYK